MNRRHHRPSVRWITLVAATLVACFGESDQSPPSDRPDAPAPEPAVRVDTVVRTDTVVIVDTVIAMGPSPAEGQALNNPPNPSAGSRVVTEQDLLYLRSQRIIVPVAGVSAAGIPSSFAEVRGGTRQHNAIDILAPRGTPVLSADDGTLAKIDTSAGGGLSLYVADPRDRFIYYYAHLDAFRRGLREGMPLSKGDTIGYVGTTGNAPPGTPHLHFAIALADEDRRWWKGTPLDPLPLLLERDRR